MVSAWEETPVHHLRLDVRSLLQDAVITEVRAHHKRLTFVIVMKTYRTMQTVDSLGSWFVDSEWSGIEMEREFPW